MGGTCLRLDGAEASLEASVSLDKTTSSLDDLHGDGHLPKANARTKTNPKGKQRDRGKRGDHVGFSLSGTNARMDTRQRDASSSCARVTDAPDGSDDAKERRERRLRALKEAQSSKLRILATATSIIEQDSFSAMPTSTKVKALNGLGKLCLFEIGPSVFAKFGVAAGDVLTYNSGSATGAVRKCVIVGMRNELLWKLDEGDAVATMFHRCYSLHDLEQAYRVQWQLHGNVLSYHE